MSKPQVEAIYPLTFMQQALLFHHIGERYDQGFLQVQCTLQGKLEPQLLEDAFVNTVSRHPSLRTSVHWEDIKKPVQIVHPAATLPFEYYDWSSDGPAKQAEKLAELKLTDRQRGFRFNVAPLSSIKLIRLKDEEYSMLWNCHHILLDGWSAAVVLKDVFHYYDNFCKRTEPALAALPENRTYLAWLQRQDVERPRAFWQQYMSGYVKPALLATQGLHANAAIGEFREEVMVLSEYVTGELNAYARRHRLTLSTVIQGLWAVLLGRFLERDDVIIGTTVSGRSAPIPNLDLVAGLFMNVLPIRIRIPESETLSEWLVNLQRDQIEVRNAEFVTLDQIMNWTDWPGHLPLFDSLLVVENFPWSQLQGGDVTIKDFSGGFTSTYPVTIVVNPGSQVEILFRFQPDKLPEKQAKLLSTGLKALISAVGANANPALSDLQKSIAQIRMRTSIGNSGGANGHGAKNDMRIDQYISPRNTTELKLTGIWEEIFGHHPIGVRDDFFQLGGSSVQAVRLFAHIEKKLGRSIPPAALMQNRTIESLAMLMKEDHLQTWDSLVPIRARGSRAPLFCVHAGGAHVLFYHALARRLGSDQPVYALQPAGLDGRASLHKSVEEMAEYYVQEIRKVQPQGPYAVLGTCFGNAVCLEMARQLQAADQSVALLAIIDSGVYSQEQFTNRTPQQTLKRIPVRYDRFVERFRKDAVKAIFGIFRARLTRLRITMEKRFNFLRSRQTRSLYSVQRHLLRLHLQYSWAPYEGKVTLIRSSESTENPNLDCHISQWSVLAKKGVDVFVVPGHHETIFQEPEVEHLGAQLKKCLYAEHEKEIITHEG